MGISELLPIIIYFLLIALIIIFIIIGIKLINTMNKVDKIVDNINGKVESLNTLFDLLDKFSSKVTYLNDTISNIVISGFRKITNLFRREKDYE